jgi:hypothetical protein
MKRLGPAIVILLGYLLLPDLGNSCGPFPAIMDFFYEAQPVKPSEFVNGKIGVLQPGFSPSLLAVAYRYLDGSRWHKDEQQKILAIWVEKSRPWGLPGPQEQEELLHRGFEQWKRARLVVSKAAIPNDEPSEISSCSDDAYRSAANTLMNRVSVFGPTNADVRGWVERQDAVFRICYFHKAGSLPPKSEAPKNPILRSDYEYQDAAANFYLGRYDEAERLFRQLGTNASSPWQKLARYLVARTLAQRGIPQYEDGKPDAHYLSEAEEVLKQILADPEMNSLHPASRKLLKRVQFYLTPKIREHELASILAGHEKTDDLGNDLWDFELLVKETNASEHNGLSDFVRGMVALKPHYKAKDYFEKPEEAQSRLAYNREEGKRVLSAADRAVIEWQSKRDIPHLVVAITAARGNEPAVDELLKAAEELQPESPAFPHIAFHRARLLIELHRFDQASAVLDHTLEHGSLDQGSKNLMLALRTIATHSVEDFAQHAAKYPIETPGFEPDATERKREPLLDQISTYALRECIPLKALSNLSGNADLTPAIREQLVMMGFTRAVLLQDHALGSEFANKLENIRPELRQALHHYQSEAEGEELRFAGVFALLKSPAFQPFPREGLGRLAKWNQIENYRDNWWDDPSYPTGAEVEYGKNGGLAVPFEESCPAFLSSEETSAATKERTALDQVPSSIDYLVPTVLSWIDDHPRDPRNPEALYRAMQVVRFSSAGWGSDERSRRYGRLSRGVYVMIHQRYPNSVWAKKVKFWYTGL